MDEYQFGFEAGMDPYQLHPDFPASAQFWRGFEDGRHHFNMSLAFPEDRD